MAGGKREVILADSSSGQIMSETGNYAGCGGVFFREILVKNIFLLTSVIRH